MQDPKPYAEELRAMLPRGTTVYRDMLNGESMRKLKAAIEVQRRASCDMNQRGRQEGGLVSQSDKSLSPR